MSFSAILNGNVITFENDISSSTYDRCIKDLEMVEITKTDDRFKWPFFKQWFSLEFGDYFTTFDLEEFFTSTSYINKPNLFGRLLWHAIGKYFTQDITKLAIKRSNIDAYYYLNSEFTQVNNATKVMLVKRALDIWQSGSIEEMVEAIDLVGYYVPSIKEIGTYIFCSKLSRKDAVSFLKEIDCYESNDTLQPESLSIQEVFRKYNHFKFENYDDDDNDHDHESKDVSMQEANVLLENPNYTIPNTYQEAIKTPQAEQWKKAVLEELNLINTKKVYTLVNKSKIAKGNLIVESRWVFSVKLDPVTRKEIFEARIVAKGFTQKKGVNYLETYSPVARFESVRLVLCLSAMMNWDILHLNVKNAFLNGKIDHDVYLKAPNGTTKNNNLVWKLQKSIYGLKQSSRIWYLTVKKILVDSGYKNSILEPCLFWKNGVMMLLYVDDILICGSNKKLIEEAANVFKRNFEMEDMGYPKVFLGINIEKTEDGLSLSLEDQINKIEKEYNVTVTEKKLNTPLVKDFDKMEDNSPLLNKIEHSKYRSIIGKLSFLANTVRLDIAFTVSYLSRFLNNPTELKMKAAKRALQYVIQTKHFKLYYHNKSPVKLKYTNFKCFDETETEETVGHPKKDKLNLVLVSDAYWAGDNGGKKSQSSNIVLFNGNIINWESTKQQVLSKSTADSKYVALCDGLTDAVSFRNLLKEVSIYIPFINVVVDKQSALTLKSNQTEKRTQKINIKFYYIKSLVVDRVAKMNYLNTMENIADMLTKILDVTTHNELSKLINN